MSRTLETQETPTLKKRSDGSIVCGVKMLPRGRCNKLLLTPNGKILCRNNHPIDLAKLLDYALGNLSDEIVEELLSSSILVYPQTEETAKRLINLFTSEPYLFTGSYQFDHSGKTYVFFYDNPLLFSMILGLADRYNPKMSELIRKNWLEWISYHFPILERYFLALASQDKDVKEVRDRMILLYPHTTLGDPWREYVLTSYYLEAATFLNLPEKFLFEDTLKEAREYAQGEFVFPILFRNYDEREQKFFFNCLCEPAYKYKWGGDYTGFSIIIETKHGWIRFTLPEEKAHREYLQKTLSSYFNRGKIDWQEIVKLETFSTEEREIFLGYTVLKKQENIIFLVRTIIDMLKVLHKD